MSDPQSPAKFRIGLVQMRSGRTPAANLDAAAALIREAAEAGAAYVQPTEMTNIMEVKREALFAAIGFEHDDAT
ncbi:MAG: carbon-nitrogen hydrolase family protein, partial [Variibacter sp.]|nr:carbon-nitrogen hydrolase family protein [Variibacter sp.]